LPELPTQLQQGDRILTGKRAGKLVRVRLSEDTKTLLDRVCKASRRSRAAVIAAANESYLADPSYYRPHIKPDEEFHTQTSAYVSKRIS